MDAAIYNIEITKGKTYRLKAFWKDPSGNPINLAGRTMRMQMRRTKKSSVKIVDFDNAAKGGIATTPSTGAFEITIPPSITEELEEIECVYEVDTVSNSDPEDIDPVLEGRVYVRVGVIR